MEQYYYSSSSGTTGAAGGSSQKASSQKSRKPKRKRLRKVLFSALLVIVASFGIFVAQGNNAILLKLKLKYHSVYYIYDYVSHGEFRYYRVLSKNGKEGVCDLDGNEIIPPKYDDVRPNYNGYYEVTLNDKHGVYDLAGNEDVPPEYDNVWYNENKGYYEVTLNGKEGVYDLSGNEIIPPKYDNVLHYNGYYFVKLYGKEGVCDLAGNEIIPCKYKYVAILNGKFSGSLAENGKYIENIIPYTPQQAARIANNTNSLPTNTPQAAQPANTMWIAPPVMPFDYGMGGGYSPPVMPFDGGYSSGRSKAQIEDDIRKTNQRISDAERNQSRNNSISSMHYNTIISNDNRNLEQLNRELINAR